MHAKFIAGVLSLLVVSFSTHADGAKNRFSVKKPPRVVHKLDLNKVDAKLLTGSVKGIGKKRAEAIIDYRKHHHGFKSLEELAEVKGIGQHFVTVNRDALHEVFVINKTA